jgi:Protein of unknown function (DUF1588)/Protein of unknown function (DUF1592)/Protein of unknown function (DUF1595)/Protein of unknown function (DUF1587)
MGMRRSLTPLFTLLPLLAGAGLSSLSGCGIQTSTGINHNSSVAGGDTGSSGSTGSGASAGSIGSAGASTSPLLPARIRRLSNSEYESSVKAVVGNSDPVATGFSPDTRQSGYTVNDAQRVDNVLIKQIAGAATTLAAQVRSKLSSVAPCADQAAGAEACAKTFIQSFAGKAYRRPLGADEAQKLLDLYHVAADDGGTYADGIEQVATGVLQSAAFLYLTEIGDGTTSDPVTLTPYETASEISYLVTGGPPDAGLLSAAAAGQLATPEQRSAMYTRLFASGDPTGARGRVVRVIQEWLGTDRLVDTGKDTTVYQSFAGLKPAMVSESADFVQRLIDNKTGTVGELLGASWTATKDSGLTQLYNGTTGSADGEINLPERRGILNQAAFLSVYAHASETGPVLRGVAVERRIACMQVKSPAQLMLTVPPLAPDPNKTMRDRLSAHATDPACAFCHTAIDSLGFSFELYDGMGKLQTQDHGQAVNSKTTVSMAKDFDGDFADSNALATALSNSAVVRECFARNAFRASAGRSDDNVAVAENAFVDYWKAQPAPAPDATHPQPASALQGSILETLRAYITSPTFTQRRAQ